MADNAAFTINDGTNDHVFSPAGVKDDVASYQDKTVDYIPGRETAVLRRRGSKNLREVSLGFRFPKMVTETINGVDVPKVVSFGQGTLKVLVPRDWTPAEVQVMLDVMSGGPAVAQFVAAATQDEWTW